jgi:hypothetical protein
MGIATPAPVHNVNQAATQSGHFGSSRNSAPEPMQPLAPRHQARGDLRFSSVVQQSIVSSSKLFIPPGVPSVKADKYLSSLMNTPLVSTRSLYGNRPLQILRKIEI